MSDFAPHQFRHAASRYAKRLAIQFGSEQISYQQLAQAVSSLAKILRQQPSTSNPHQLYGICANRSPESIAASFACWEVGAAFVPLDPDYPAARMEQMLQDISPAVVLLGNDVSGSNLAHANGCSLLQIPPFRQLQK